MFGIGLGPMVLGTLVAIAGGLFTRRAWMLLRVIRSGQPDNRFQHIPKRLENEVVVTLGQRKLFQRLGPGIMHAMIFWGFLVLFTTILEAFGLVFNSDFALPFIGRMQGLGLVQDLAAVGVIAGVYMAVFFRKVRRDKRFIGSHTEEADFILLMILGIVGTYLLMTATTIALGTSDTFPAWMPVSNFISKVAFQHVSQSTNLALFYVFLWTHLLIILSFLVYLPYSKHLHIITSAFNVFFTRTEARGKLRTLNIDLDNLESSSLGAATMADMTWKQLLDPLTCTECGRCQDVCPAWNTGKELSPKLLIMGLRDHLFEEAPAMLAAGTAGPDGTRDTSGLAQLNPGIIEDQVLWDCTTCGACMQECPVNIEHIDHIVDMRRNLVMAESRFPAEAGTLLRNLEQAGNPWAMPQAERGAWADGLGVRVLEGDDEAPEYLYWVGCAGSYDDRARNISKAVVDLLQKAGVPFAILGSGEKCTGDPARRIGNEYLYQEIARSNIETLNRHKVRKVITNCPHCFNTLANEYPDLAEEVGTWEVLHHTQLLATLVKDGRLTPSQDVHGLLSYHDPCYLGRHNEIYDEPRRVLKAIPLLETVEMPRHKERGFCCGAGGARMWLEEPQGKRINVERMDEAASTGADMVGVACPYCLIMLDDAAKDRGDDVEILDVAQVVARAMPQ